MRFVLAFCFVVVRYVWCVSLCSVSQRFVLLFYFGSFRAVFFHFDLFRLLRQVSFPRVLFLCFVFLRFVLFCLLHYVWFLRLKSFFCNCSHSCTRILNVRACSVDQWLTALFGSFSIEFSIHVYAPAPTLIYDLACAYVWVLRSRPHMFRLLFAFIIHHHVKLFTGKKHRVLQCFSMGSCVIPVDHRR